MRDDRLGYDVPDEEYDNMSEEERQVIDENTLQDAREMMRLIGIEMIQEYAGHDYRGHLDRCDMVVIERALYNLAGGCALPYPKINSKPIMNKLRLGDIQVGRHIQTGDGQQTALQPRVLQSARRAAHKSAVPPAMAAALFAPDAFPIFRGHAGR